MALLGDIKKEICAAQVRCASCRKMLLYGMLAAKGVVCAGDDVHLFLTGDDVEALARHLICEQLGREPSRVARAHGGRLRELSFESAVAARMICSVEAGDAASVLQHRCPECSWSFLRGAFLVAGRMSDPERTYHMELSLGDRALVFRALLTQEYALSAKLIKRKSETLLYFKDSSVLEEILTMLGVNQTAFLLMNSKIGKEFRNAANRRTNCEAGNIRRSVIAASRTVSVIRRLAEEGKLSSLPEELESVARLRLEHPEASLAQLAAMMTPPITKSGLNHRLEKILEYAKES